MRKLTIAALGLATIALAACGDTTPSTTQVAATVNVTSISMQSYDSAVASLPGHRTRLGRGPAAFSFPLATGRRSPARFLTAMLEAAPTGGVTAYVHRHCITALPHSQSQP